MVHAVSAVIDHDYRRRFSTREWPSSFSAGRTPVFPTLIDAIERSDFGIFLLVPTDVTKMRVFADRETDTPRDNVIFELGLFIGMHGAERVYCLYADSDSTGDRKYWLPTDFVGALPGMAIDTRRIDDAQTMGEGERAESLKNAVGPAVNAAVTHFDIATQGVFRGSRKRSQRRAERETDAQSMWGRRFQRLSPNDVRQGDVVLHPLFGLGTVVETQTVGGTAYLLMDFDDGQRRVPLSDDFFHPQQHPGDA